MPDKIRIRIPQKSSEEPSPQTQSPGPTTLARHKPTAVKRRVVNSDQDDYDADNNSSNAGVAGLRGAGVQRPVAKRARRSYSAANSMEVTDEGESEIEVDVPESSTVHAARKVKPSKKPVSGKKRRAAVLSSDEEDNEAGEDDDDEFMEAATQSTDPRRTESSPLPSLDLSDGDFDRDLPTARSKPVRQKNPTWKVRDAGGAGAASGSGNGNGGGTKAGKAAKAGGASAAPKVAKTKPVKKESKEIPMKDERKTKTPPVKRETSAPKTQARAQSKESQSISRAQLQAKKEVKKETKVEDIPVDIVNDSFSPPSPVIAKKEEPTSPPTAVPPKKTKYPTIKKNKPPGSTAATTTATTTATQTQPQTKPPPLPPAPSSAAAAAVAPTSTLDKAGIPSTTAAGAARTAPATADFDLRDKSAWASIFKQTGASTPRTGLTRREKEEERRKELYKMRDEARAKREESFNQTFDLQASWDKISRFEERLRANRSSALYPNLFAAKFRDEWEMERKRARQREWEREKEGRERERDVMVKDGESVVGGDGDGREGGGHGRHERERERGHV